MIGVLLALSACASSQPRDRGWEMIVAQDYAGARAYYEEVLRKNPDDPYAHLNLGVALEKLGDKEGAERHYREALRLGGDARIAETAEEGQVQSRKTTVAELAEENLRRLAGEG